MRSRSSARTVAVIAAADSRSWWARLTGRRPDVAEPGAVAAAQRVASGHFDLRSVWLHNSVRGAVGLALAVLLARAVRCAERVLDRAGRAVGAAHQRAGDRRDRGARAGRDGHRLRDRRRAGRRHRHRSRGAVDPAAVGRFSCPRSAPTVISFVAGQAAFTVFSIILFNIIAPAGWRIGVFRIEDVALGCLASLVAGLLFWPRGAAAALGAAYADAYRTSSAFLRDAIAQRGRHAGRATSGPTATAAGRAARRRVAAVPGREGHQAGPAGERGHAGQRRHPVAAGRDGDHQPARRRAGHSTSSWTSRSACSPAARTNSRPGTPRWPTGSTAGVGCRRRSRRRPTRSSTSCCRRSTACGNPDRAARAERLLWSGQYLGDVNRQRAELLEPAAQVRAARARPWWRR